MLAKLSNTLESHIRWDRFDCSSLLPCRDVLNFCTRVHFSLLISGNSCLVPVAWQLSLVLG